MLQLGEQFAPIAQRMADELQTVQAIFADELRSDLPCVNELADHLEQYRGKMLRPTLVLLSGLAVAPDSQLTDEHHRIAAVVEMVHMATLVHDDILDEQDVRRRTATINHLRGNEAAVMLGDYLISHAYHLCSSLNSQTAARLIADATNVVCEGELLQLANRNNWDLDEETYFEIIRRKTASLCGVSCKLGAHLADVDPDITDQLYKYGELLGSAFQIIDDVLDLTGDPEIVGKSLGKDLEKGKLTLPLIHRLAQLGANDRRTFVNMIRSNDHEIYSTMGALLCQSDSVVASQHHAEQLVDQAKSQLIDLPDSSAKAMLLAMADAVIDRDF